MLSRQTKCAIIILAELEKEREGERLLSMADLKIRCAFDRSLKTVLNRLRQNRYVGYDITKGKYWQSVDLSEVTLYDLVTAVEGAVQMGSGDDCQWPETKHDYCEEAKQFDRELDRQVIGPLKTIRLSDIIRIPADAADDKTKPLK